MREHSGYELAMTCAVLLATMGSGFSSAEPANTDPLFGSAAHQQTIRLAMDEDQFDGAAQDIRAGETVRFLITNRSALDHAFVVGEADDMPSDTTADEHGAGASGGHNHQLPKSADAASPLVKQVSDSPSVDIPAGVTRELLVHFPRPGHFSFACPHKHHLEVEMAGYVRVLAAEASARTSHRQIMAISDINNILPIHHRSLAWAY